MAKARNRYKRGSNQDPVAQAQQRLAAKGLPGAEQAEDEDAPFDSKIAGVSMAQAVRHAQQQVALMGRSFGALRDAIEPPPREPPITRTGKALGFRSWKLDGYNLFSANQQFGGWKIDEPTEAICHGPNALMAAAAAQLGFGSSSAPADARAAPNPAHGAPHPGCGCGLYALHAPEFMSRWHQGEPLMVHGAVLGWGRMEVHHEGWRAQYAQPVMLAFDGDRQPYNHCERVKAMGSELGLPVVEWPDFEDEARKLARPVPEELRPERSGIGGLLSRLAAAPAGVQFAGHAHLSVACGKCGATLQITMSAGGGSIPLGSLRCSCGNPLP